MFFGFWLLLRSTREKMDGFVWDKEGKVMKLTVEELFRSGHFNVWSAMHFTPL